MDDFADMDDTAADLFLAGLADAAGSDAGVAAAADFVSELRATALHPPAPVSPALAAVLRDGLPTPPRVGPVTGKAGIYCRQSASTRWRRALTTMGIGFGVATSGVTVAAAANLLPAGPERVVGSVVKALTPFELATRAPVQGDSTSAVPQNSGQPTPGGGGSEQSGGEGEATTGHRSADKATGGTTSVGPGSFSVPGASGSSGPFPTGATGSTSGSNGVGGPGESFVTPVQAVPSSALPSATVPAAPGLPTTPPAPTSSTTPPVLPRP